jgi:23S rRNA pseudouridine1911/1915/1917 synthase
MRVLPEQAGQRLDVFLAEHAGSRAAAQKLIDAGLVTVGGEAQPKRYTVREGDEIDVGQLEISPEEAVAPAAFSVAYEDDDLLVIDKPAGVVVHPGSGYKHGTLVQALGDRVAGGSDPVRPGVVHRLDRDTSGLLLMARSQPAWESLSEQIRTRAVTREYLALADGRPPARAGTIDAPLGRDRRRRTRMSSDTDDPREAVTHFELAEAFEGASLLRLRLETGRTHQIRAHLLAIGHPVLGDPEYGVPHPGLDRQFLHAARLELAHPISGERLEFSSPLPQDLAAALLDLKAQ